MRTPAFVRASSTVVQPTIPKFDPALEAMLDDIHISARDGRPSSSYTVEEEHITPAEEREGEAKEEDVEALFAPREERMSPAAVLATKRLGLALLPEPLVEGVTAAIKG